MTNPDSAWRRIKQQTVTAPSAQEQAEARMQREREIERRELAAAQGVTLPVMPPRLPGESDRDYGCRIAWIAKAACGPAPRPKLPPRRIPKLSTEKAEKADKSDYQPPGEDSMVCHGERLAGMTPDLTTEEEP